MSNLLRILIADSQQACDCVDCDGKWCIWCLEHHGKKRCPFIESVKEEIGHVQLATNSGRREPPRPARR